MPKDNKPSPYQRALAKKERLTNWVNEIFEGVDCFKTLNSHFDKDSFYLHLKIKASDTNSTTYHDTVVSNPDYYSRAFGSYSAGYSPVSGSAMNGYELVTFLGSLAKYLNEEDAALVTNRVNAIAKRDFVAVLEPRVSWLPMLGDKTVYTPKPA